MYCVLASCKPVGHSGFWSEFHKQEIIAHHSDQGPWGGHRYIQWKVRQGAHISASEINVFATKNGWKLFKQYTFPLSESVSDYSYDQLKQQVPSQMQSTGCRLLVFQTGWLLVAPGNDMETYHNGFVVISANGTEWMMYHIWGE